MLTIMVNKNHVSLIFLLSPYILMENKKVQVAAGLT